METARLGVDGTGLREVCMCIHDIYRLHLHDRHGSLANVSRVQDYKNHPARA